MLIIGTDVDPTARYSMLGTIAAIIILGYRRKILNRRWKVGLSYGINIVELLLVAIRVGAVSLMVGIFVIGMALTARDVSDEVFKDVIERWEIVSIYIGCRFAVHIFQLDLWQYRILRLTRTAVKFKFDWGGVIGGSLGIICWAYTVDGWYYLFVLFVAVVVWLNERLKLRWG